MSQKLRMVAAAAMAAALLSGCAGATPTESSPASGSVSFVTGTFSGVVAAIAITRTVTLSESDCLSATDETGDIPLLVPEGTTVGADGESVVLPSGTIIRIGDEVTTGFPIPQDELDAGASIPEACSGAEVVDAGFAHST